MRPENKNLLRSRKRNIALLVAYDGTNYHGFQRQSPPTIAIQNVLEDKLQKIFGDTIELAAAGRTDAGVHALGQIVNFFTDGTIPIEKIPLASKALLPADIVVREAREVVRDFSARHSAKSKIYAYHIQTGNVPNPFTSRYAWHICYPLDIKSMESALSMVIGRHDFSAFRAAGGAIMSPIRTIFDANINISKDFFANEIITIKFHANGFLYHMARNIVGSIVAVGRGHFSVDDFKNIFYSLDRSNAAPTAPAHGLFLNKVLY